METNNVERAIFLKISQAVMSVLREHANNNPQLEQDLYQVLELIDIEQVKADYVKALAYELAAKLG
jgi:hypothetical protein